LRSPQIRCIQRRLKKNTQLGPSTALGRFFDGLLQSFEDRRPGLLAATLDAGEPDVAKFFADVYEAERERLRAAMRDHAPHLSVEAQDKFYAEADRLVKTTVIPAYVRVTTTFTRRERNGFYLVGPNLQALERVGWGAAGIVTGAFVVWAPFIPLWSKEWVFLFLAAGLFFPNIRSYLSLRKYERELNDLVLRSEREVERIDRAYLDGGEVIPELKAITDGQGPSTKHGPS
jgi:hypothetical protein